MKSSITRNQASKNNTYMGYTTYLVTAGGLIHTEEAPKPRM